MARGGSDVRARAGHAQRVRATAPPGRDRAASRNCSSGDARRRPANGRERSDVRRALRLHGRLRQYGTKGVRCNDRRNELRRRAARQMLKHLTRRAVVIRGMRRTSRDVGSVVMMMMLVRLGTFAGVFVVVHGDGHAGRDDPRQRSQRRPDQREQRVGRDPRTPARVTYAPGASLRTTRGTHESAIPMLVGPCRIAFGVETFRIMFGP